MSNPTRHDFHPTILREYDMRGVVGETLHEADAHALGMGFAACMREAGGNRIALGYDGRISSPQLAAALTAGLVAGGMEVIAIGMAPTPQLYFAGKYLDCHGAIEITGSHNPPDHNGFKMVLGGKPFFGAAIKNLGPLLAAGVDGAAGGRATSPKQNMLNAWLDHIMARAGDVSGLADRKIIWDCGNGATGPAVLALTQRLGKNHIALFTDVDGSFPNHHPDPADPANLENLRRAMRDNNAALGIAFDGDGDRIGLVDGRGRSVAGDIITAYLARDILREHQGGAILFDIKSSAAALAAVKAAGGKPALWKTGHSHMKTRMNETGAVLAGEMSGHIFARLHDDGSGVDDALYAALCVLRAWLKGGESIETFAGNLPATFASDELRIPCDDSAKFKIMESIIADAAANPEADEEPPLTIDGLRVATKTGWWLLRASNTGGYLVARCEAGSAAGRDELLARIAARLKKAGVDFPPQE